MSGRLATARRVSLGLALLFGLATPALAQRVPPRPRVLLPPAPPRITLAVSGGYQPSTTEFGDTYTFELDRETARTRVAYPVGADALFDAGAAVRLWRGLGAGVSVSRFTHAGRASTTTSLPHPLFLEQHREVTGETGGLDRTETAIHVQAQYALPPLAGLHIVLAGGPSFLQVDQSLINGVRYSEAYPYDEATFTGVDTRPASSSAPGFHAGVDMRYMFSRTVGAGVLVRFTRATVDLETPRAGTLSIDAGGTQIGAGIRLQF